MLSHGLECHRSAANRKTDVSAVVLAGGDSSRFGTNKLHANLCGKTLLEHVLRALTPVGFREIIVVVNGYQNMPGVKFVREREHTIFSAIITGIQESASDRIFLTAGDMPFLNPHAIIKQIAAAAYSIPVWQNGNTEPFHSVVSRHIVEFLQHPTRLSRAILASGSIKIPAEDFPEHVFFNVNTRKDLETACRIWNEKNARNSPISPSQVRL